MHGGCSEALEPARFQAFLEATETHLRRIGREIFAGPVAVAPYRKGSEIACDRCLYRAVCRFDPWVEPYRVLRPPPKPEKPPSQPAKRRKKS